MKKAAALREHLVANVATLKADPLRLSVFIERGAIACRIGSLSYEYRYDLSILVTDYADDVATLIVPLMAWIAINEPGLLQNPDTAMQAIQFEAEIIDSETSDVLIKVPIREAVVVTANVDGWTAEHLDEPELPDLAGPAGWEMFLGLAPNPDYEPV